MTNKEQKLIEKLKGRQASNEEAREYWLEKHDEYLYEQKDLNKASECLAAAKSYKLASQEIKSIIDEIIKTLSE